MSSVDEVYTFGSTAWSLVYDYITDVVTDNSISTTPTSISTYAGYSLDTPIYGYPISIGSDVYSIYNGSDYWYVTCNGSQVGGWNGSTFSYWTITYNGTNYFLNQIKGSGSIASITLTTDSSLVSTESVYTTSSYSTNISTYSPSNVSSGDSVSISSTGDIDSYDTTATYTIAINSQSVTPTPTPVPVTPSDYSFTWTDADGNEITGSYSEDVSSSIESVGTISTTTTGIMGLIQDIKTLFQSLISWLDDFFDSLSDTLEDVFSWDDSLDAYTVPSPTVPTPSPTPTPSSDGSSYHGGWIKGLLSKLGILSIISHITAPWGIVTEWISSINTFLSWFATFLTSLPRIIVLPFYGSLCMFAILVFIKRFIG